MLWDLVLKIRAWMVVKWRKNSETIDWNISQWTAWKFGGSFSSEHRIVRFESAYHKNAQAAEFWACNIKESWPSKNGRAPREWVTEIGYQQTTPGSAAISIVIYYRDRPGFIGPCEPEPAGSIPNIIRKYVGDRSIACTSDGYPFTLSATHLAPGDFPEFWQVVCDEKRDIPVIYISPRRTSESSDRGENLIDPQKLVDLLGPNALIYYADSIDFSREMTELCVPRGFGCYSGGIRIYAPHPHSKDASDSYRHRYISPRNLMDTGDSVYGILRRALAQDVHFYDKMFRMEDCKLLNDRAISERRKQEYRDSLENELLDAAIQKEQVLQQQLRQIEEERFQWEVERESYRTQIQELKADLYQANQREDAYKDAAELSNSRKAALDAVRKIARYPKSPQEIAAYFSVHFSDRIAFTEKGENSLRECHTDLSILWDALYQMATTLYDLFEDDDVAAVDQTFNRQSTLYFARGEGSMTRKDSSLMRQYRDVYQGKDINIEAHIKTSETKESSPRFLRIYFCYDSELHKIIIGSCGKHLDNYTTSKIK